MNNEIKEILFLLHNDRLTDSGKRKLENYITNLIEDIDNYVKTILHDSKVIDNLQQRIDKAIEYIEKNKEKQFAYNYEYYLEDKEVESLLNILKGSEE